MRRVNKGVGMTANEMIYFDTPSERKNHTKNAMAAWDAANGSAFELSVAPMEALALEVVARLGGKAAFQARPHDDSLEDRVGERALMLLKYLMVARKASEDNNLSEAARNALKVAEMYFQIQTTIEWEKFALRGQPFVESSRGRNKPYRAAAEILTSLGLELTAKDVHRQLVNRGVCREEKNLTLTWKNDQGVKRKITWKAFNSHISQIKKNLR